MGESIEFVIKAPKLKPDQFYWWDLGEQAFLDGKSLLDNPVDHQCFAWRDWRRGFIHAYYEANGTFP